MSDATSTKTYDEGKSIEELFPDDDMIDHVIDSTGMYAGTRKPTELTEYVASFNETNQLQVQQVQIVYPPALYKCIDEAIVNALDNMVRLYGYTGTGINDNCVTMINMSFSRDGRITVRNNGRGVPIGMHSTAGIWSVQMIFGNMFKGRKKSDKESKVTGDANRVGIKLANILSTEFSVETVFRNSDGTCTKYSQKWYDHMRKVDPPAIVQNVHSTQYTEVSFMPDYEGMFYTTWSDKEYASLDNLFRLRMYTAAAYAGFYTNGQCKVSYQNEIIKVHSMADLAAVMFPTHNANNIFTTHLTDTTVSPPYRWEVCVVIAPNDATNMKNVAQITNVNGVNVRIGKHISSISTQIIDNVREYILKKIKSTEIKFQPSYVYNNIFIFLNTQIPGVEWQGQRKDEMLCDTKKVANYKLPEVFVKKIAVSLEDEIMSMIYGKTTVTGISRKKVNVKKYQAATRCGREPEKCFLLCPEGDSAASMICNGIAYVPKGSKKPLLGFDYYGYLILGGVIMNARKEITIKVIKGKKCIDLSEDLAANEFFTALLEVTGLDLNATYDPLSSTYKKEKAALRYGGIIGCVDQDHDGSGFIFPLLSNIFEIFWPNLLAQGYLKKWDTPRRRVTLKTNKKTIIEFYSDYEYDEWVKIDPVRNNTSYYDIDYIKGLAGHEESAVFRMFRNFQDNLITMYPDAETPRAFEVMFGRDSSLRKDWLKTPIIHPTPQQDAERRVSRKLSCTLLINNEGKEHAMSNLQQKLWSAVDGMNESGRKILDGSLKVFTSAKEKMKVVTLQGHILAHEHYQHGEASLQESIVGKALLCVGAIQLPQLLPRSNFGTRRMGGGIKDGDSGHPRYISTSLNKKLTDKLYPDADYANYEFVYEDGQRVEPKYFVPVLPMAILESTHMPAHGWKIQVWARDVLHVIQIIKYLINTYDVTKDDSQISQMPIGDIRPDTRGFRGEFREIRGTTHCFGDYKFDPKTRILNITELPLRVWSQVYCDSLVEEHNVKGPDGKVIAKSSKANLVIMEGTGKNRRISNEIKMFSGKPTNHSNDDHINIEIQIAQQDAKSGIDPLKIIESYGDGHYSDGFENYFELHQHVSNLLSMIATDESVIEFESYEDVIRYWFPIRKRFYELRIDRQLKLMNLRIILLENIIRYVDKYTEMNISKVSEERAIEILTLNSFDRIHHTWLEADGYIRGEDRYIPNNQLEQIIVNSPDAKYNYLLNTTDHDKLKQAIIKRKQKYEDMIEARAKFKEMISKGKFKGVDVWLQEIEELEQIIKEGFKTKWGLDEN